MINLLGKTFVLIHTVLSLIAMSWAVGIYLDFIDWGWETPHKDIDGTSIASEFDKSYAAVDLAVQMQKLTIPEIYPNQETLSVAESAFSNNHLAYVDLLKTMANSTEAIEVKALKEPGLPIDSVDQKTGKPIFDAPIARLVKSKRGFTADLEELVGRSDPKDDKKKILDGKIDKVQDEIVALNEKIGVITELLNGKDNAGKQTTYGIYQLTELEFETMTKTKFETEEIKPRWASVIEDAKLFALRRNSLQKTLSRLEDAKGLRK